MRLIDRLNALQTTLTHEAEMTLDITTHAAIHHTLEAIERIVHSATSLRGMFSATDCVRSLAQVRDAYLRNDRRAYRDMGARLSGVLLHYTWMLED